MNSSRIYTGQHGQMQVVIADEAYDSFRANKAKSLLATEYLIVDAGGICGGTKKERNQARAAAWKKAGWVAENSKDYPEAGDQYTGAGVKVVLDSPYVWETEPYASLVQPRSERRCSSVRNWSFSMNAEVIDTTVLGNTYRSKVPGLKSVSGSAQLLFFRDVDDSDTELTFINAAMGDQDSSNTRNEIRARFKLVHPSQAKTRVFDFPAIITGITINCAVGDVVTYDITFESMDGVNAEDSVNDLTLG